VVNIRHLLGLRELQRSYYASDREISAIIKRQILEHAVGYGWSLSECGHHAEARRCLLKYWRRYPLSVKLVKVLIKNTVQDNTKSTQRRACQRGLD
jgi:hypothetical protein